MKRTKSRKSRVRKAGDKRTGAGKTGRRRLDDAPLGGDDTQLIERMFSIMKPLQESGCKSFSPTELEGAIARAREEHAALQEGKPLAPSLSTCPDLLAIYAAAQVEAEQSAAGGIPGLLRSAVSFMFNEFDCGLCGTQASANMPLPMLDGLLCVAASVAWGIESLESELYRASTKSPGLSKLWHRHSQQRIVIGTHVGDPINVILDMLSERKRNCWYALAARGRDAIPGDEYSGDVMLGRGLMVAGLPYLFTAARDLFPDSYPQFSRITNVEAAILHDAIDVLGDLIESDGGGSAAGAVERVNGGSRKDGVAPVDGGGDIRGRDGNVRRRTKDEQRDILMRAALQLRHNPELTDAQLAVKHKVNPGTFSRWLWSNQDVRNGMQLIRAGVPKTEPRYPRHESEHECGSSHDGDRDGWDEASEDE